MTIHFNTRSIRDFPKAAENSDGRGVVMLPVRFHIALWSALERELPDFSADFFTAPDGEAWKSGDVSEAAHVTLLYGLMTPAYEQPEAVAEVLEGWRRPPWLIVTGWEAFGNDPDSRAIVATVTARNRALEEAHSRLSYLPHVNTFPEYKPHVTLAYVKPEAADRWLEALRSGLVGTAETLLVGDEIELGDDRS